MDFLERLYDGEDLAEAEAEALLAMLVDPEVPEAVKGGALIALRAKGETPEELRGLARAMRERAAPLPERPEGVLVDTCGTGGDGSSSFNISTAAALLLAGLGLRVVKHGNRSVSSRSGSADVLEALGIGLPSTPEAAGAMLRATGFTFLFAPRFHAATAAVVPTRRALKTRTVFNLLGPLTNPARPTHQLIGAFSAGAAERMAHCLSGLGVTRAFVVHGAAGWDEATPVGPFELWDVAPGRVRPRQIDPTSLGLARCSLEELAGGSAADNAATMRAVLGGRAGPIADAVALNAGLVLEVCGRAPSLGAGLEQAREGLRDGCGAALLTRLGGHDG